MARWLCADVMRHSVESYAAKAHFYVLRLAFSAITARRAIVARGQRDQGSKLFDLIQSFLLMAPGDEDRG
ncbi:hypothetical protein [Sorangium sp. So ce590]|uniref:hypothetical protein n=1 Tax=unclassified Sorangium TaxID=2621164 RepID=UPI003F5E0E22